MKKLAPLVLDAAEWTDLADHLRAAEDIVDLESARRVRDLANSVSSEAWKRRSAAYAAYAAYAASAASAADLLKKSEEYKAKAERWRATRVAIWESVAAMIAGMCELV